jgi:hypothetical protein
MALEKSQAESRVMQNNLLTQLEAWHQAEVDNLASAEVRHQPYIIRVRGFDPPSEELVPSGVRGR